MRAMAPSDKYKLRPVTNDDLKLIFEWANDDDVRKNSFNQQPITFAEHKQWFENVLDDKNCLFYLFIFEGHPVGQIRVNIENETGYISYSIAKKYRGHGYGGAMLAELENVIYFEKIPVERLVAEVRPDNIISKKKFEQAGYSSIELVRYVKDLSFQVRKTAECKGTDSIKRQLNSGG